MASPDEARAAIAAGRIALDAALAVAVEGWRAKPEGGEGEEAWSPQQAAKHVLGAEIHFAGVVCEACGYPGPSNPIEGVLMETPQEAQHALTLVTDAADAKIKHLTAEDMEKPQERWGTVGKAMERWAGHLQEHAAQIRAASA